MKIRGQCPGCGTNRLLPGLAHDGITTLCRDCAGITRDFFCDRCGYEGLLLGGRLCERCTLSDRLTILLDDGTGRANPALTPLANALLDAPSPKTRLLWIRSTQVQQLLRDLATGALPMTHDALGAHPSRRTVAYLRDLLMTCGLLPTVDKQLLHVETWLNDRLAVLPDTDNGRLLRQYATWRLLPRLRTGAGQRALPNSTARHTALQFTVAEQFLAWLHQHDRKLSETRQADLDTWYVENLLHNQRALRDFLNWAMTSRHMPKLKPPSLRPRSGAGESPMTQHRRLALLRKVLTDQQLPLRIRITASLVLLYAQPVSRIVRLTLDDIIRGGTDILLRLGDPPTPVPEPLAGLLLTAAADRENMSTATNPGSRFLFPGRRPGQPINPYTLYPALQELGIPTQTARTSAIRQLVLQAPAPVIAQALGYHPATAHRHAADAGGTWTRYAPGDHARPQPRLPLAPDLTAGPYPGGSPRITLGNG
jgi:hypothetical protein